MNIKKFFKRLISGIGKDTSTMKGLVKIGFAAIGITITGGQLAAIICVYPAVMGVIDIFRKDTKKALVEETEALISRKIEEAKRMF